MPARKPALAKSLRLLALATVANLVLAGTVDARLIRTWSDSELVEKSDLVVIATPTATSDTKERVGLPGLDHQPVVGVETKFEVIAVRKGEKSVKSLILHHYRVDGFTVPNGPNLVSFDISKKQKFVLFLVREKDGRYAPTVGQVDPGVYGIRPVADRDSR